MKIKSLKNHSHLRNHEFFQFMADFKRITEAAGPATLGIQVLFSAFAAAFTVMDDALQKIVKSDFTHLMDEADKARDSMFAAFVGVVNVALKHFSQEVADAGRRLKILLDTYGNLAKKPRNEQTSGTTNLLQELNGKYKNDVALVRGKEYVDELGRCNNVYVELADQRYEENAEKCKVAMECARVDTFKEYQAIVERINAGVVFEGPAKYEKYINLLNEVIDKYNSTLNMRKGKK